jgi:WD40 repeat protein
VLASPSVRRGRRRWLAVAAAGLLAAAALGAIIVIQLPGGQGKLEIESLDPDVEITVKQDGRQVAILDKKTQQEVTLPVGAYEVELKGKPGLTLETQQYTLKRGKTEIVRVMQVPTSGGPEPPLPSIPAGEPLSQRGLVSNPAKIEGVQSWTFATVGHNGGAGRVAYSPDDRIVATCGDDADGTVHLWAPDTGRLLRVLVGHQGCVAEASWSPDAKWLAAGSFDGTVKIWQVESGRLVRTIPALGEVLAVAWSPIGNVLAIGSADKTLRLVNPLSGEMLAVCAGHTGPVNAVGWSPDGKSLASMGGAGDRLRVWNAQGEPSTTPFEECQKPGFAVAWSSDGKTLAGGYGAEDNCTRIWDANSGKLLHTMQAEGMVTNLSWSPDCKKLVTAELMNGLQVWDVASGKNLCTQKLNAGQTLDARWSHDGKHLAFCNAASGQAQILDAESLQVMRTLHAGYLPWAYKYEGMSSWSPDGQTLALTDSDHTVQLWDLRTGLPVNTLGHEKMTGSTNYLAWSPDGKTLCCGTPGNVAVLFDAKSGVALGVLIAEGAGGTRLWWWSPDGKTLASATGTDKLLRLSDPRTRQLIGTLEGNEGDFQCAAWSADGKILASGGRDAKVRLWEAATGKPLQTLEGHMGDVRSLAWSPDGKTLASSGADSKVLLWEASSGKQLRPLQGQVPAGRGGILAWSADSKTLDTIELSDSRIRTWDVATGQLRDTVTRVCSGALSPNRKTGAAHNSSVTVELTDADTGRRRALLVPLGSGRGLAISAEGHYRGTPGVERELGYVVQTDKGQEMLTPDEFARRFGWKNDPERVKLR